MKIKKTVTKRWKQLYPLWIVLIVILSILTGSKPTLVSGCDEIGGSFSVEGASISSIQIRHVSAHGAWISWVTDLPTTSQVFYDVQSRENINDYAYSTNENTALVTSHLFKLSGLSSNTMYYFRVRSIINGVATISGEFTFTTLTPSSYEPPPIHYAEINIFGKLSWWPISYDGYLLADVEITSTDGRVTIYFPNGIRCLDSAGNRLEKITVETCGDPPQLPGNYFLIGGICYIFSPSGATFDPPLKLTLSYDEENLPEGMKEEDLLIAWYDENTSQWVELESTVDTENNTVTAFIGHFTVFAIIGKVVAPETPASFSISSLNISPDVAATGEVVTINALVSNTGEEAGSYTVTLSINGVAETTREITVSGGLSKEVTFQVSKEAAGVYEVDVNGLSGSFRVEETTPAFILHDLFISPGELFIDEQVEISVIVSNTGEEGGNYQVTLRINDLIEDTRDVYLSPGTSQRVSFVTSRSAAGTCLVDVNGLTGTFTVKPKPVIEESFSWPLVVAIPGGIAVIGLLVYFLLFRRRRPVDGE